MLVRNCFGCNADLRGTERAFDGICPHCDIDTPLLLEVTTAGRQVSGHLRAVDAIVDAVETCCGCGGNVAALDADRDAFTECIYCEARWQKADHEEWLRKMAGFGPNYAADMALAMRLAEDLRSERYDVPDRMHYAF